VNDSTDIQFLAGPLVGMVVAMIAMLVMALA